jgi:hypothetical protein
MPKKSFSGKKNEHVYEEGISEDAIFNKKFIHHIFMIQSNLIIIERV